MELPVVRTHERMTWKRCPKKWYWQWRMGLVPKRITFGALDLGTWMHDAFDAWYGKGLKRNGELVEHFYAHAAAAIKTARARGVADYIIESAVELRELGAAMATAYGAHYGRDKGVRVIGAEIPLEFTFTNHDGSVAATHLLKPDLVYLDVNNDAWLMEHKTAGQMNTEHLTIDDQARPYGAMAERALRRLGLLPKGSRFMGIMYNFLRKAYPDDRLKDGQGRSLNKNGTVSKRQPAPLFKRHPVKMTAAAKRLTLHRLQTETMLVTDMARALREGRVQPETLPKTPSKGCPKFCDYFSICSAEDAGSDIRQMTRDLYRRENPYTYRESTEDRTTFEMG